MELLTKARDIRNRYRNNKNYRTDIGVMEDLIKNYVELFEATGAPVEKLAEYGQKAGRLLGQIREQERDSPRVEYLRGVIRDQGLSIGI